MGEVYLITNTVNGKYYVGKTTETVGKRWRQHRAHARFGSNTHFHNAIRKHGAENFKVHTLMTLSTEAQCLEQEKFLIGLFRSYDPKIGYNGTLGGEGINHTFATRTKMSATQMGHPPRNLGMKHSPETRAKMSANHMGNKSNFGRKLTPEHKANISAAGKVAWVKRRQGAAV